MSGFQDQSNAAQQFRLNINEKQTPEICMKELTLKIDKEEIKFKMMV